MHKFLENVKADVGLLLTIATATATTFTGTAADMRKYNNFAAYVAGKASPGTNNIGDLTCYIAQSTDMTTWSTNYLATATAASATGGLTFGTSVEVRAEQMGDSYRYLRVEVLPADGTQNIVAAANLRFNSRFPQASLPS